MEPGKKLFWKCTKCSNVKSSTPNQAKTQKESVKVNTKKLAQPLEAQSPKFVKEIASSSSEKDTTLTGTEGRNDIIEKTILSSDPAEVECTAPALGKDGALTSKLYETDNRPLPISELCDNDSSFSDHDILECFTPLTENENRSNLTLCSTESHLIKSPETIEKITFRKKNNVIVNIPVANSFESLSATLELDSDDEDEIPPCLNFRGSCPELNSVRIQSEIEQLREKVIFLEQQLASADNEIVNLLSENIALKEDVAKYNKKCNYLGKLCLTSSCKKQKVKSAVNKTMPTTYSNTEEISTAKLHTTTNSWPSNSPIKPAIENNIPQPKKPISWHKEDSTPKICVLSADHTNKVSSATKNAFLGEYDFCHYNRTNCGTRQLLTGLDSKLKNFTMADYCIVFVSENDFLTTQNYSDLVMFIKENLEVLKNTNIIICSPTYRHGKFMNIYNSRVEAFNNLLCRDIETHKYAYLVDSNNNLEYEFSMFHSDTGIVNRLGMRTLFNDVVYAIVIAKENVKNQFFRGFYWIYSPQHRRRRVHTKRYFGVQICNNRQELY
ncbi:hypothetical protein O0L34_g19476 [Tuta absoluta]|nr:hypothetical protein O0L34_g19476 [Tuta absoluta]